MLLFGFKSKTTLKWSLLHVFGLHFIMLASNKLLEEQQVFILFSFNKRVKKSNGFKWWMGSFQVGVPKRASVGNVF